jgi:hypothetical protein
MLRLAIPQPCARLEAIETFLSTPPQLPINTDRSLHLPPRKRLSTTCSSLTLQRTKGTPLLLPARPRSLLQSSVSEPAAPLKGLDCQQSKSKDGFQHDDRHQEVCTDGGGRHECH